MQGKTISQLAIGQSASSQKTVSESDIYLFAGITGDFNPAHVSEVYANGSRFKKRIAHGMLSAGLVSAVLAMQLPGPGSIYLGQTLKFTAPVYIGDTITATVTVTQLLVEKNIVKLQTTCTNQNGVLVLSGEASIMPVK